jgi:signal transduction histidine kinase
MPGPRDDRTGRPTFAARARAALPTGAAIDDEMFESRHRAIVVLLWLHAVGLAAYGISRGYSVPHLALEIAGIVAAAVAAAVAPGRMWRAGMGTLGLVACSALLVHLSGGLIEAHFHFFIVVILVTLYQSWVPFLLALLFVVVHHGTVGVIDPGSVYNHPAAVERPWLWALVHGMFVTGAALAAMVAWKHVEMERERAEAAAVRLHDRTVRHREAMELNDTVVQGLVSAKYATQLGRTDIAAETIERTLAHAQSLVAELMDDETAPFDPGTLRRAAAAAPAPS